MNSLYYKNLICKIYDSFKWPMIFYLLSIENIVYQQLIVICFVNELCGHRPNVYSTEFIILGYVSCFVCELINKSLRFPICIILHILI